MRNKFHNIVLLILAVIIGCETTSNEDYAKGKITEVLNGIEMTFNTNSASDVDEIMQFYNINYRYEKDGYIHNYSDAKDIWEERLWNYESMEIRNIEIELFGDFWATVNCELVFYNNGEELITYEPSSENGDISYFYKSIANDWQICGKDYEAFGK